MLNRPRAAAAGVCLALLVCESHAQQTQVVQPGQPAAAAQTPAGSAAITGSVIDAVSGRPIAGALVVLEERRPGSARRSYAQIATPRGRFAFLDLPSSEMYVLTTAKAGYLDGGFGRLDPRGPGAPLAVQDGQWLRDVRATMARPGSVSGTVSNELGEPLVGVRVRVLPQVFIAGRVQWLAGAVAQTDDRGAYRISGLGPGRYVVSVPSVQATLPVSARFGPPGAFAGTSLTDLRAAGDAARAEKLLVQVGEAQQVVVGHHAMPPPPLADGHRVAYPIAFYPNASRPAEATSVELRVSEDRVGIDFHLRPVRTARLSGAVQGPPDAVGNLLLRLIPVGLEELGQGSEAATTVTTGDGRFTFLDVPTGSYVLDARHTLLELTYTSMDNLPTALPAPVPFPARIASSSGVAAAPPGVGYSSLHDGVSTSYWGQLRVDVGERDVSDLVLALRRPVSLSGRMMWAPGSTPTRDTLRPRLEPADGRRSLGVPSIAGGSVGNTLNFRIEGLMAGEYVLRVSGATVQSINWNGEDYTDRPFDGAAGRDVTDVVVTLTTASSSIRGVVTDGATAITSGAAVIAYPIERERWSNFGFNPRRLASVLTTSDGRYQLNGLPPGAYHLIAVHASQERGWLDPSFLASHVARARQVNVTRSDATVSGVTLSLVE